MKALARLTIIAAAALALQGRAYANVAELACTSKTADATEITSYPATINYTLKFSCTFFDVCTSKDLVDSLVGTLATPSDPMIFSNTSETSFSYPYTVESYEACAAAAGLDPATASGPIDLWNVVTGTVEFGLPGPAPGEITSCSAKVVCQPPSTGPTRTMGFFKTHVDALQMCLGLGGVNLGFTNVTTLSQALGLLWAEPSAYTGLNKARLLLGRQLLVAQCNERLFGSEPTDFSIADAISLLAGNSCTAMKVLTPDVDAFNNSNDLVAFPAGFDPGSADPGLAQSLAGSPGLPGGTCAP